MGRKRIIPGPAVKLNLLLFRLILRRPFYKAFRKLNFQLKDRG